VEQQQPDRPLRLLLLHTRLPDAGVGEALGALLGPQRVASRTWRSETKPVMSSSDDRKA